MGSSSSRIGSDRSSEPSRINRTKRKLSSLLLCGLTRNSNSHSPVFELESPISSLENLPPASVESISSAGVSSSFFGSEPTCTGSKTSNAEPEESESCNSSAKNVVTRPDSVNNSEDKASTSHESQPIQESNLENHGSGSVSAPIDAQSSVSDNIIQENLDLDENSGRNVGGDIVRSVESDTRALLVLSDSFLSLRMFGSGLTNSGSGFFSSDVDPNVISGRILVLDTGSVSPNEFSSRETRRNYGRVFGNTSSDDFGARDRWLLDISGDLRHDGRGHGYSRRYGRSEERRNFRSRMSERGLSGVDDRFCASGLHRDGTCSCGSSFMGDEGAASFGSISRVVLLAQALSEVLDEIHRQPLSLSMPMLSLPAPESVVDSLLLKNHKKIDAYESGPNYVQQCYICLVDYEEGDKIRVLPCQHEYHAPCVDKWLKEVNGVCPVCRCNVCDTPSVSSSEVPT